MPKFTVEEGSVYNPGWTVYEHVSERHLRSCGTFDTKQVADDWCKLLNRSEV